ncbi:WhiB family transcriptional regulator [Streptomyces sp. NPDC085460]|uniref:WhiB family transcriptional regulator n=1 Tax=Streptomyces sp. NPDC085460 TaxID=3365723 RepID=UPI0037D126FF
MSQPDPTPWQAGAACAGLSPSVVFARRERQAAPALRACAACPVPRECEAAVAPAESWFDGVCAGRLWRNGRPVKPRSPRYAKPGAADPLGPLAPGRPDPEPLTSGRPEPKPLTSGRPEPEPLAPGRPDPGPEPLTPRTVAAQLDAVLAAAASPGGTA